MAGSEFNIPQRQALVFNVQKYNTYDGPGVRTVVFFKGCPLRCKWCSNPEGIESAYSLMHKPDACVNCGACVSACPQHIHSCQAGMHRIDRSLECTGCLACVRACLAGALEVSGEKRSVDDLYDLIADDIDFYRYSGGGVTLGGGEVLMQPEAAIALLSACKNGGINTAIETSGYCSKERILSYAEHVDLFLFDIKHMDEEKHKYYTGVSNRQILENLSLLLGSGRHCVMVRLPILAGINDDQAEIEAIGHFLTPYVHNKNFQGVNILPYHRFGVGKYQQLGRDYPLTEDHNLSEESITRIEDQLRRFGIAVRTIRH